MPYFFSNSLGNNHMNTQTLQRKDLGRHTKPLFVHLGLLKIEPLAPHWLEPCIFRTDLSHHVCKAPNCGRLGGRGFSDFFANGSKCSVNAGSPRDFFLKYKVWKLRVLTCWDKKSGPFLSSPNLIIKPCTFRTSPFYWLVSLWAEIEEAILIGYSQHKPLPWKYDGRLIDWQGHDRAWHFLACCSPERLFCPEFWSKFSPNRLIGTCIRYLWDRCPSWIV